MQAKENEDSDEESDDDVTPEDLEKFLPYEDDPTARLNRADVQRMLEEEKAAAAAAAAEKDTKRNKQRRKEAQRTLDQVKEEIEEVEKIVAEENLDQVEEEIEKVAEQNAEDIARRRQHEKQEAQKNAAFHGSFNAESKTMLALQDYQQKTAPADEARNMYIVFHPRKPEFESEMMFTTAVEEHESAGTDEPPGDENDEDESPGTDQDEVHEDEPDNYEEIVKSQVWPGKDWPPMFKRKFPQNKPKPPGVQDDENFPGTAALNSGVEYIFKHKGQLLIDKYKREILRYCLNELQLRDDYEYFHIPVDKKYIEWWLTDYVLAKELEAEDIEAGKTFYRGL